MKIFNIIFIVYFVACAALQYNDPDPYVWIPIYLYAAFLCYQAFQKKYIRELYYIGLAIYAVYAAFLFFDESGFIHWIKRHNAESILQDTKGTKPWIEESREFLGLLIIIAVLLINMWVLGKNGSKKKKKK